MTNRKHENDEELIRRLIRTDESRLIEFKEIWYDLSLAEGKAKLTKDVLALANSLESSEMAYMLFGVRDRGVGGGLLGLKWLPDSEAVAQILADYTTPPPLVTTTVVTVPEGQISLLTIEASGARPHHATREYPGILNPSVVYVRRDKTNGIATSLEVEQMLLERIGRHSARIDQAPLRTGFVGHGHTQSNRTLVMRVTNVTEVPVAGVDLIVDLIHASMPEIMARERLLTNATIQAGESREVELPFSRPMFYYRYFDAGNPGRLNITSIINYGSSVGDRWLTALMRVYYRDNEGFLQEIVRELALDA